MIGKIVTGKSFRGAVEYVLGKAKARLLDSDGVDTASVRTIIDDRMRELAAAYMERMGIVDTQYIVARHNDTEHPHLHIVYNRVRYDKKLVLDKHERRRNVKACRELKLRFGLTFAKGKERVKVERLRNADKIKYQIYAAIGRALPECQRVPDLVPKLKRQGIEVRFIHRGNDPRKEVQGMTFTKAGQCFKASQIDRKYSYGSLVKLLREQVEKRAAESAQKELEYLARQPLIPVEPIAVRRQGQKPIAPQEPQKQTRQPQKPVATQGPRKIDGPRPAMQEPWDIDKFIPLTQKLGGQQAQTREQDRQKPRMPQAQPAQAPRQTAPTEHIAAVAKQTMPKVDAPSLPILGRPRLKPVSQITTPQIKDDRPQVITIPPRKRGHRL